MKNRRYYERINVVATLPLALLVAVCSITGAVINGVKAVTPAAGKRASAGRG